MQRKYAFILGNLGNTKDRFCGGYKDNPSTAEMLKQAASIPHVRGVELVGTWDIRPDNAREMKTALGDLGLECVSLIPDLFADPLYWKGSYTSPDPQVRRRAIDDTRRCARLPSTWAARSSTSGPGRTATITCSAPTTLSSASGCARRLPAWRSNILPCSLPWNTSPRSRAPTRPWRAWPTRLLLAQETGCTNVGVTIDTGHAFVGGEVVGEAIVLAQRAGQPPLPHALQRQPRAVGRRHDRGLGAQRLLPGAALLAGPLRLRRLAFDGPVPLPRGCDRAPSARASSGSAASTRSSRQTAPRSTGWWLRATPWRPRASCARRCWEAEMPGFFCNNHSPQCGWLLSCCLWHFCKLLHRSVSHPHHAWTGMCA